VDKHGRPRDYSSAYLRRTYREAGKVKNETVANLSALPGHVIDLIDAELKGQQQVPASEAVTITRSVPHGHVAAVHAMGRKLGLPALLGPSGPHRDLALALVISRVAAPASKLSTLTWWADTTLGADLGVAEASTGDINAAMDWLASRQDAIEAELAARHLAPAVRSPPPAGPRTPRPRPPISVTRRAAPTAASAACSSTWQPSPATRSGSSAPRPPCRCSPSPPAPSRKPSI
jgi:hypothetical protein